VTRKRIKPKAGDLFAVPLTDGSFGLGHIAVFDSVEYLEPSCVLFAHRAARPDDLLVNVDEVMEHPIGVMVTNASELRCGAWPIIGWRRPDYAGFEMPKFMDMKHGSYTVGVLPEFLEAYHGLRPWDEWPMSATWYGDILLPGVPIPPTARYTREFPPSGKAPPAAPPEPPPPVTEGPAEIHVQILYPGNDLPTVDQLHTRQELERRLEAEGAGEVTDAGGGEGVMDVYLETDDVQRSMPIVERLVAELGIVSDTLIEAGPVDEGEDDEDDEGEDED
jgi:hypothetical protein